MQIKKDGQQILPKYPGILFLLTILFFINPLSVQAAQGEEVEYADDILHMVIVKSDSCVQLADYECAIKNLKLFIDNYLAYISAHEKSILYNKIGDAYYAIGQFDSAVSNYKRAFRIAADTLLLERAMALKGIAHVEWRKADNLAALNKIMEAIDLFEKLEQHDHFIAASNILAGINIELGDLKEAESIYIKMLSLARMHGDSISIASNYEYLGVIAFFKEDFRRAISYYDSSLLINRLNGRKIDAAINQSNIAEAYMYLNEYKIALLLLDSAIQVLEKYNINSPLIFAYYTKGQILEATQLLNEALVCYRKSLSLMQQSGEERERYLVLGLIAGNYALQKDFEQAYHYHRQHSILKDSIFNNERSVQLQEIKARFEIEKKEQENIYLSQENTQRLIEIEAKKKLINVLYCLGAFMGLLLITAIYLAIKLYNNKIKLDHSNSAKDILLSIIAHDLRGPIGNIKVLADLLHHTDNEHERNEVTKLLRNASSAVFILVKDLLSWTFTQTGGFKLKAQRLELKRAIDSNMELLEYQYVNKSIVVENRIGGDLAVYADPNALAIIFRNLLSNAIKFTKAGGSIIFDAEKLIYARKPMIRVAIHDSGIGMDSVLVKRLLTERTFQSKTGTAKEQGNGIGFNLIRDFVNASNGYISIESKQGKGTLVHIYLPEYMRK